MTSKMRTYRFHTSDARNVWYEEFPTFRGTELEMLQHILATVKARKKKTGRRNVWIYDAYESGPSIYVHHYPGGRVTEKKIEKMISKMIKDNEEQQ